MALDAAVLAVAPGPHEADALVEDLEAFLPGDVALLPAWEALPYEGISPAPDVAARRAAAVRRLRERRGATVLVAPALAAMQGLIPTLGTVPPIELSATEIRLRVRRGLGIEYLTPEGVVGYVREKGLYR